jgi:hypothetical protein
MMTHQVPISAGSVLKITLRLKSRRRAGGSCVRNFEFREVAAGPNIIMEIRRHLAQEAKKVLFSVRFALGGC